MAIDFQQLADLLKKADIFDQIESTDQSFSGKAREAEEDAFYRIGFEEGTLYAGLYIQDRWLSESIETELLHCGDTIDELLEEEMVELGLDFSLKIQHFRNDNLEYVFRSPITQGDQQNAQTLALIIQSYNACFEQLGDMGEEEDPFA